MDSEDLHILPTWKSGPTLTAADRLHELALIAQTSPEKFEQFVLVRVGKLPEGRLSIDHYQFGCDLTQQIGLFSLGQALAIEESKS